MNELIKSVRIDGPDSSGRREYFQSVRKPHRSSSQGGNGVSATNPFPLSVFDNVAYGQRVHGTAGKAKLQAIVEKSLRATWLFDEVKDKLNSPALELSPEQQQRLCISRLAAIEPEVLLMDEPCSALDPFATAHVEELMRSLAEEYTIVIVTHNMQQAARVSSETAFMLLGDLVEFGPTTRIFENPSDKKTEEYVSGRYG